VVKPAGGTLVLSPCAKDNSVQRHIQYISMPFFIEFNGRKNGIELSTIFMPECGKRSLEMKIFFSQLKFLQNASTLKRCRV
jgi:hypothetical protein